jgi:hypothetical protein
MFDLRQPALGQASQLEEEGADLRIGQAIRHVHSGLLRLDQAGSPEHLEVVGGGRHAPARLVGERFDRPGPLRQEIEELEATRTGGRLADTGNLLVDLNNAVFCLKSRGVPRAARPEGPVYGTPGRM